MCAINLAINETLQTRAQSAADLVARNLEIDSAPPPPTRGCFFAAAAQTHKQARTRPPLGELIFFALLGSGGRRPFAPPKPNQSRTRDELAPPGAPRRTARGPSDIVGRRNSVGRSLRRTIEHTNAHISETEKSISKDRFYALFDWPQLQRNVGEQTQPH